VSAVFLQDLFGQNIARQKECVAGFRRQRMNKLVADIVRIAFPHDAGVVAKRAGPRFFAHLSIRQDFLLG